MFYPHTFLLRTLSVSLVGFFVVGAVTFAQEAPLPGNVERALRDLSSIYGSPVETIVEARAICSTERLLTECAEIGKRHHLYTVEEEQHVDAVLEELKGKTVEELKSCTDTACLVTVANKLARELVSKDPATARALELTPTAVAEKREIVEAAKEVGVDIARCRAMDPNTAAEDLLRACAKLAKHARIREHLPEEAVKALNTQDATVELQIELRRGGISCGDGTIEGCGNFCLNPSPEARRQGVSAIAPVCRQIAERFFGAEGVRELERAYREVATVGEQYAKRAELIIFTTALGRTLNDPAAIGRYLEGEAKRGNVSEVDRGMDFMIARGFARPSDKEFALSVVRKISAGTGEFDFDRCSTNPKECDEFVPDEERGRFEVFREIENIIEDEIAARGITDPGRCERDGTVGDECIAAARAVLPRLEAIAARSPEARAMVEEMRRHISLAEGGLEVRRKVEDRFRAGEEFRIGDRIFRSFREMEVFCRENGQLCLVDAAKQGFIEKDVAAQKYKVFVERQFEDESYRGIPAPGRAEVFTPTRTAVGPSFDKKELLRQFEAWLDNPEGPLPIPLYHPPPPGEPFEFGRGRPPYPYYPPYYPPGLCPRVDPLPCEVGKYRPVSRGTTGCPIFGECTTTPGDEESRRRICPAAAVIECPTGSTRREFVNINGCATLECVWPPPVFNSSAELKLLFPGEYNNTKYTITVIDPDGLEEVIVNKATGGDVFGASPSCRREVTSGTVTLLPGEFPLTARINDCRRGAQELEVYPPPTLCPALSTVGSCPAGSRKVITWSSPECGDYYGCEPESAATTTPAGDAACADLTAILPGCHFMPESPNVRFNADMTRYVIVGTQTTKFCSTDNIPGCTTGGNRGAESCTAELTTLLGSGCHSMGNAYFNGGMTRYVLLGARAVIECSVNYITNCTEGTPTYHPPGGCTQELITLLGNSCHQMVGGYFNGEMTRYVRQGTRMILNCLDIYADGCVTGGTVVPITQTACTAMLTSLLGSGCHSMGNAHFNGEMRRYVLPGESTVRECTASYIQNCTVAPTATTTPSAYQCSDGRDNDGDGAIDYPADTSCYGTTDNDEYYPPPGTTTATTTTGASSCSDGRDNDGDGRIDYPADTGCYSSSDDSENFPCASGFRAVEGLTVGTGYCQSNTNQSECQPVGGGTTYLCPSGTGTTATTTPSAYQCSDGRDNDGDGAIDYPADTSCYGTTDNDEYYPPPGTTGGDTACQELESLIPGCHIMPERSDARFNGAMTQYVIVGTRTVKLCSTDHIAGCTTGSGTTTASQCSDGRDNDGDGAIDYPADTGCYSTADNDEVYYPTGGTTGSCTQELITLLGSGCHSMGNAYFDGNMTRYVLPGESTVRECTASYISSCTTGGTTTTPQCSDGRDNDGDGAIDYPADTSCYDRTDNDELYPSSTTGGTTTTTTTTQCSDGRDNDGDGAIDYPADTGCYGTADDDEAYYPPSSTTSTASCPSGYHYMGDGGGYCMSDSSPSTCQPTSGGATYTCPGGTTTTSTSCAAGQYWNGTACVTTTTSTTTSRAPGALLAVVGMCPQGHLWNGIHCLSPRALAPPQERSFLAAVKEAATPLVDVVRWLFGR